MELGRVAEVWKNLRGARSELVITVAGTNGKGSCIAMLEAALRAAGISTGAYTSPHLVRYNERIRVDGVAASDAEICNAFAEIEHKRAGISLTFFEYGTLCALLIFQRAGVTAALLEVGLGGRLDAVNIVKNDLALITTIGLDHTKWLGDTREEIARQKVGILKNNAQAVCAEPNPPQCITETAAARDCLLLQNGNDYTFESAAGAGAFHSEHPSVAGDWRRIKNLPASRMSRRQMDNLGGVIAALALLAAAHPVGKKLHPGHIHNAVAAKPPARCQVVDGAPRIILDVAHNMDSANELADFLRADEQRNAGRPMRTHAVVGMLRDKPLREIVQTFADMDRWYFAALTGPRGQNADAMLRKTRGKIDAAAGYNSPRAAYDAARAAATAQDRIVVFGSFHTVGAILADLDCRM